VVSKSVQNPTPIPFAQGYDPVLDEIASKMRSMDPPELFVRFTAAAGYVAGLCPRCRDPFRSPAIPTSGYQLKEIEVFVDCACPESHGRTSGTSCGAQFKVSP